jgi:hypothetical protein
MDLCGCGVGCEMMRTLLFCQSLSVVLVASRFVLRAIFRSFFQTKDGREDEILISSFFENLLSTVQYGTEPLFLQSIARLSGFDADRTKVFKIVMTSKNHCILGALYS